MSAWQANAQQPETQTLERVEVTGSAIKRQQVEGPAPVEIYSRKDIERTGASSLNEFIRSVPSIDIFDQGEQASNSPAGSGTANIRLRGLSENNVLILLNGRRLPVNALYDSSGAGAAVDINSIPLSAIERVEILKDGGSAIYGADAVAGVVNFITKKDYQGLEARIGYGETKHGDGAETKFGLAGGFGNYDRDGYNVFVGLDYFKRDPIYRKDREISRSSDFRRFGGPDGRSSFAPEGNLIDPATFAFTGATLQPCPADRFAGGRCRYDFNSSLLTLYNGAERVSGMLLGSFRVTQDIRAFGELMYSHAEDTFEAHPVPDIFVTPGGDLYFGRFMQGGPRTTERKSDLTQLTLGLEGTTGKFDWKVNAGQGLSKVTNHDRNYLRDCPRDPADGITCAPGTGAGTFTGAAQAGLIDPTVTTNDPALVESVKYNSSREGESKLTFANAIVSGEAWEMKGGPLGWAVGTSWWRESLQDTPDPLSQQGLVLGSIQQAPVDASRNAYALFGELRIPILKNLEAQAALRYDHYPSENKTSPKIALRYVVTPAFSVRASYTESFRAPSLKQLYGAQEEGAADFTNDTLCAALSRGPGCTVSGFEVNGSNPNLKPEKGKTYNIGFVFEPTRAFNASIDFWRINKEDDIGQPTIDTAISQGQWVVTPTGVRVFTNLLNFAETSNSGVDLDARLRFTTSLGAFSFRDTATYYYHQRTRDNQGDAWAEFNATYAKPRWRNVFSATLERGPWAGTAAVRSVGGFSDTDQPDPAPGTRWVGAYEEFDVGLSYTGLKNLKLDFGVKNLFDRMPPFSRQNAISNLYTQVGYAELYSARGRFVYGNLSYTFR